MSTLPQQFGRYRILTRLGEGGMGTVYLAEDTRLRRRVALKVPHFSGAEHPTVLERFYREARMAAQIHHPNLCAVYDVDCLDGTHYLTMAYIEGTPLARFISPSHPWPVVRALELVRHLALALQVLHEHGIIHRDLKPSNVMIRPDGTPVLMDFGLARPMHSVTQQVTTQQTPLGTPAYMAPEQVIADQTTITPATDLYALGVILYQLLTGQLPFSGENFVQLGMRIVHAPVPPLNQWRADLDPVLCGLCLQPLAKKQAERPASMKQFAHMLGRYLEQSGPGRTNQVPPSDTEKTLPTSPSLQQTAATPLSPTLSENAATPRQRQSWVPILLASAGILVLLGLCLLPLMLRSPTPAERASAAGVEILPVPEITLQAGQSRRVRIQITRKQYDGEIQLWQEGSMRGVEVTLHSIPAQAEHVEIQLSADRSAPAQTHTLRLLALGENALRAESLIQVTVKPARAGNVSSIGLELVHIPAGKFIMGSPAEEEYRYLDEVQHEVEISQTFYMSAHEITVGQFRQFVEETRYTTEAEKDGEGGWGFNRATGRLEGRNPKYNWTNVGWAQGENHPVVNVTWSDTQAFCTWLSDKEGRTFRLPTEAEWEYACRAQSALPFASGSELATLHRHANIADISLKRPLGEEYPTWDYADFDDGFAFTAPVGSFQPNAFGLYDMHGNVWEWCEDWHGEYDVKPNRDPRGPAIGTDRMVRGGSFCNGARYARAAHRTWNNPSHRGNDLGFRVVTGAVEKP